MDKELQDYYDARFSMFASKGWKDLVEDVEKMVTASDSLSNVKTVDDLNFCKGELSIMRWLLGLKDMTNDAFKELTDAQSPD